MARRSNRELTYRFCRQRERLFLDQHLVVELRGLRGGPEAGLGGEPIQVAADIPDQHVGQIAGKSVAHHDPLHYQILPVRRHPIGRNLPPPGPGIETNGLPDSP